MVEAVDLWSLRFWNWKGDSMSVSTEGRVGLDPYNRFRVPGETDPCQSRHHGNLESRAAWDKVKPTLRETYEKILEIYRKERRPLSPKEICQMLDKHPSDLSGRFTELKEMGILVRTHQLYDGSRCLELAEDWLARTLEVKVVTKEQVLAFIKELKGEGYTPGESDVEFADKAARLGSSVSGAKLITIASLVIGRKLNPSVNLTVFFNKLASKILQVTQ
jgi:DNA-binding Lrp family transcriptional regulator